MKFKINMDPVPVKKHPLSLSGRSKNAPVHTATVNAQYAFSAYGFDFVIHKKPEGDPACVPTWVVSEFTTGGAVGRHDKRSQASEIAKKFILTRSKKYVSETIKAFPIVNTVFPKSWERKRNDSIAKIAEENAKESQDKNNVCR